MRILLLFVIAAVSTISGELIRECTSQDFDRRRPGMTQAPCPSNPECPRLSTLRQGPYGCCCEMFVFPPGSENCATNEYLNPNGNKDWAEGTCANPAPMGVAIGGPFAPKCTCTPFHVRIGHTNRACIEEKDCGNIKTDYSWSPCEDNEVFTDQGKFDFCDATCENPNSEGVLCPVAQVYRCQCKPGFIRKSANDRTCIPVSSCPSCSQKFVGGCLITNAITLTCPENPVCQNGYQLVRKGSGCCCEQVPLPLDPNLCKENEVISRNAPNNWCRGRCANPNPLGIACGPGGGPQCVCKEGYIHIGHTNRKCIKKEQCGITGPDFFRGGKCAANEIYKDCAKFDFCDKTCGNPTSKGIKCPNVCVNRCECKEGFVRKSENDKTCVALTSCPARPKKYVGGCVISDAITKTCPSNAACKRGYRLKRRGRGCCCEEMPIPFTGVCKQNEEFTLSGPIDQCEGRCANPNVLMIACPSTHGSKCICKPGYVRVSHTDRTCVKREDCGNVALDYYRAPCSANEVLKDCAQFDFCDKTCANPTAEGINCPNVCTTRCECKDGFVRMSSTDPTCVALNTCPVPEYDDYINYDY